MFKLVFVVALSIGIIQLVDAICNECNPNNGVACNSAKAFHPCFQGVPDKNTLFSCLGKNEICTKYGRVCMDTTEVVNVVPACGDTSNCGKCSDSTTADGAYVCTSRTTFTMCFNGQLSSIRSSCPPKQICSVELGKLKKLPCVPQCMERKVEICDLKDAIDVLPPTTTTTPTTTEISTTTEEITTTVIFAPTPPPLQTTINPSALVCSQGSAMGRYPYTDGTCTRYIYCFRKNGIMEATIIACPVNLFYNPRSGLCGAAKPRKCT